MHIAQISTRFYPAIGGVERTTWETSKRLALKGNSVFALTSNIDNVKPRTFFPLGQSVLEQVHVVRFRNLLPNFLDSSGQFGFIMPSLITFLKNLGKQLDIVHSHGYSFFPSYGLLPILKSRKFKWIITGSASFDSRFPRQIYDYTIGKAVIKYSDKIICQNQLEKKIFMKWGKKDEDTPLIPAGVYFPINHNTSPSSKIKLIIDQGKFILFVGRIAKNKGLDLLVQVFSHITKSYVDIKLVICGPDGGEQSLISNLIAKLKMESKIIITGPVTDSDLHWLYTNSLIFVAPSLYGEAQNMAATQALKYGKPVIVSDSGGMPDFYKNVEGTIISRAGSLNSLRESLIYALSNLDSIKVFEKKKVIYTWDEVVDLTLKVYKNT